MRHLLAAAALVALAGCRQYEPYPKLVDQTGLMNASAFAKYGPEHAEKIAIGRRFAELRQGNTPDDRKHQILAAAAYASRLANVVTVTPDTIGYWLNVEFTSGWQVAVLPLEDDVRADSTTGIKFKKAT